MAFEVLTDVLCLAFPGVGWDGMEMGRDASEMRCDAMGRGMSDFAACAMDEKRKVG